MYAATHSEMVEPLPTMVDTLGEDALMEDVAPDWDSGMPCRDLSRLTYIEFLTSDLVQKCLTTFESNGDIAVRSKDHKRAIVQFSAALFLNPSNRLLVKRSNARAMGGMWEGALKDADEVRLGSP